MREELILIRGMPGSGKSTLAKKMASAYSDTQDAYVIHIEADMFFMVEGEYKFDHKKLHAAHQWCYRKADASLAEGKRVIVSNTFTTIKELRPYFELAKIHMVNLTVILAQGNFKSIHDVPEATLVKMARRFEYNLTPLWDEFYE